MKLLIVDDYPVNLRLLRAQLEAEDHGVVEAANGVDALRLLEREPVDAVISDILMPEMDGFRLCLEIRKNERLKALPFVFYTATYSSPQDRELASSVGGDEYLLKPSPVREIMDAVRRARQKPHSAPVSPITDESDVLKRYSVALVQKLEQKNEELDRALQALQRAHDATLQLESRYRAVFENAAVGIAHTSLDGRFVMVNPAFCEMTGYTPDESLNLTFRDVTHPESVADSVAARARLLSRDAVRCTLQGRLVHKGGDPIWVDADLTMVSASDGTPQHFVTILHDISERKRAELALQERDAGLRRAHGMARLASVVTGPEGEFESWSESLPAMIGVSPSAVPATTRAWMSLIHPDDREAFRSHAIEAGRTLGRAEFEYRLRRPDGDWVEIHQVSEPLGSGGAGTGSTRWFGTLQDVTEAKRNAARLRESERRLRSLMDNVGMISLMLDREAKVSYCNDFLLRLAGSSRDEVLGADWFETFVPAGAREECRRRFGAQLAESPSALQYESPLLAVDGRVRTIRWHNTAIRSESGETVGTASLGEDITERREQEQRIARLSRLKEMHSSINALVTRTRDRKVLLDEVCRIAVEQAGMRAAWVGWHDQPASLIRPIASAGHLEGMLDIVSISTDPGRGEPPSVSLRVLLDGKPATTNDVRTSPDVRFHAEAVERGYLSAMHLPLVIDGKVQAVLVLCAAEAGFFDEDEQRSLVELAADVSFALDSLHKSERLDYLAYFDPLTGLPNRRLFHEGLSRSLRGRGGKPAFVAVALIDIERMHRVNATFGRHAGDALLREAGARLLRANDSVSRVGTDVYALVLRGANTAADVHRTVERVALACFADPFEVGGQPLAASCRVGVALHPADGDSADTLLANAEAALKRAKQSGDRLVFFSREMNARIAEALVIENRLHRALDREEFVLHYQPKVDLASGRVAGVEALIRWQDPERGLVPPGLFIPILEESGLITRVGTWAIERALHDVREWQVQGLRVSRVAVNVSAIQLRSRDFDRAVIEAVEHAGASPEQLELEITESLLMSNVEQSILKLSVLRGTGISMSMDDFGTGYSSLSYLARLPIDKVKIDRSFVAGIMVSSESLAIVAGIIALVHSLKLRVVAEGVETAEQAARLAALECDEAQGYYFSRPVPAAEIAKILLAGGTLPAK